MLDEETNVFVAENKIIRLNIAENIVLGYLIENKRRCVTAREMAKMLGYSANSIRRVIYDLREKLKKSLDIKMRGYRIGYKVEYIGDTNDNKTRVND